MFPQVSSVFLNWLETVQMKVISKQPVDFELQEDVLAVPTLDMVLQAMSPKEVQRKPENERIWKWWDGWTTTLVEADAVLQDPDGVEFRVTAVNDWSQGGFYKVDMVEQPKNL